MIPGIKHSHPSKQIKPVAMSRSLMPLVVEDRLEFNLPGEYIISKPVGARFVADLIDDKWLMQLKLQGQDPSRHYKKANIASRLKHMQALYDQLDRSTNWGPHRPAFRLAIRPHSMHIEGAIVYKALASADYATLRVERRPIAVVNTLLYAPHTLEPEWQHEKLEHLEAALINALFAEYHTAILPAGERLALIFSQHARVTISPIDLAPTLTHTVHPNSGAEFQYIADAN